MPELPEVETIKQDLEKVIIGKKITKVCINNPRIIKEPSADSFKKGLEGVKIEGVLRKAKVLILKLSNGKFLVIHLKMTGQLIYPGNAFRSRISFYLSDGKILDFNDQRLFAEIRLLSDWRSLKFIQGLGPEPSELSAKQFSEMLANKKTKIKPLLMDQTFISGIGNLYVAESLFRAKIDPTRAAFSLADKEKDLLLEKIKEVLNEAITYGGSSVDDYLRLSGKRGEYVSHHMVYGRQGKPCLICKTPIKRIAIGGRGTFFCSRCQR